jgi:hypothetical protein
MFINETDFQRADWPLISEGAVTLFWRTAVLNDVKDELRRLHYRVVEVSCATVDEFISDLSAGLNWMEQFGYAPWTGNLNALNDGLRDPSFGPANCLALCFEGFHRIDAEDRDLAQAVLDLIESQSRNHLLLGRRLLALVQTDQASFFTPELGGRKARWNGREWLNSARGLA